MDFMASGISTPAFLIASESLPIALVRPSSSCSQPLFSSSSIVSSEYSQNSSNSVLNFRWNADRLRINCVA